MIRAPWACRAGRRSDPCLQRKIGLILEEKCNTDPFNLRAAKKGLFKMSKAQLIGGD